MNRRVWLKAYCSNEHYNADCDYAFVDLTPEYVDRILKYHAAFEKAQREFRRSMQIPIEAGSRKRQSAWLLVAIGLS